MNESDSVDLLLLYMVIHLPVIVVLGTFDDQIQELVFEA